MFRRLIPLILSYGIFFGSHNIFYTILLPRFSPVTLAAMSAFALAALLAIGVLLLTEKCLGISVIPLSAAVADKVNRILYLWLGFLGLFTVNIVLSLLFSPNTETNYLSVSFISLLSAVIVHPIGEEFLFRRLFLTRLACCLPKFGAVCVTAILFAISHYASGYGNMLYAFCGGLILGSVYLSTGKILFSVLIHSAVNLLGLMISENILPAVCTVSAAVLMISLLFFIFICKRKEKQS